MGIAITRVSNKMLVSALSMPEDAVVHDVKIDFNSNTILIKWTSAKCPELPWEGATIEQRNLQGE